MKNRLKIFLISAAALAGVLVFTAAVNPNFNMGKNMEILINMMREISLFYVDEVDSDKMLADAAAGMTARLDPYTEFISEEDMAEFEMLTTGKYGGIGSLIRQKEGGVQIAQPYKDSPADRAGLRIGDRILEIDGRDASAFDTQQVSAMLKGDPGTTVTLKIQEFYTGEVRTVSITRERIAIPGVPYYGFVADGIGYIQHVDFTEDCSAEMRWALMQLKEMSELKGLILDYRSNGGGILTEAVKVLSLFVPKGTEVVSMRTRDIDASVVFRTETEPVDTQTPIAVLINGGSASAAEIVAGALQDLDRAVLFGQRTFGKGLVQATRPLGYNSYLKITTARYHIPSGRHIQAIDYAHRNEDGSVGVVPDSLIKEYSTAGGRKVYDGGGIMPDVRIEPEYLSRFTLVAYGKGYLDDFVDDYVKRNPDPVDPDTFRLGDEAYNEFIAYMEDKDVDFESETKRALAILKNRAQRELYYDRIGNDIADIEKKLVDDKESHLKLYRDQLSDIIENDIVLRSNYAEGVARHKLPKDKEVQAAAETLADIEKYRKIVTSQDTERK